MEGRPFSTKEVDPLLKDLTEKKQSFRRGVRSLAAEIKDVRSWLALKEETLIQETLNRQEAEAKVKDMEDVISQLQRSLEEKNRQLLVPKSNADQYLKELDNLRSQHSAAQATADKCTASAQFAQLQCLDMLRELDGKKSSTEEHDTQFSILGVLSDHLRRDLETSKTPLEKLKNEVSIIKQDIMVAVAKAGAFKDEELRKILEEITAKDFECIKELLAVKDEEIARLKDEIGIMKANSKLKTKEFESELEKYQRSDLELKKRVLKLEFCLQETRSQVRKLQRTGEKTDKALEELRDQLTTKQKMEDSSVQQTFWESYGFKIGVSLSILVLVLYAKR